jgi:F0F1-type ATP synthase alpha subunit
MGIFAGSGVGKSTLLSMIAAGSAADVMVIGLIGERGRELHDFLEATLGENGRARSVVVVATSDQPAMLRRRAAYLTLTVAEFLRDQGLKVLCLMDSVTRFAMALREIYLAAGEVPTSRGYPPGVFAELPRLLERAGPGADTGSITGLFTVLVEGDDTNEPISDTVRGILDGHVVLDRAIAEGGRFPAVDPLRSLSRTAPACYAPQERELAREARRLMRLHADMAELIRLGAYRSGANAELDRAIAVQPALECVLRQNPGEHSTSEQAFAALASKSTRWMNSASRCRHWRQRSRCSGMNSPLSTGTWRRSTSRRGCCRAARGIWRATPPSRWSVSAASTKTRAPWQRPETWHRRRCGRGCRATGRWKRRIGGASSAPPVICSGGAKPRSKKRARCVWRTAWS